MSTWDSSSTGSFSASLTQAAAPIQLPLYDDPANPGAAAGGGSGGAGAGAGAGSGGGGGSTPITVDDNFSFIPPGSTTPVKWGEYSKGFIPVAEHQTRLQAVADAKALLEEAKRIDAARASAGKREQPQRPDPLAKLRGQPVLDGDTLASALDDYAKGNIEPLVKGLVGTIQQLKKYEDRFKTLEGRVGTHDTRTRSATIDGQFDSAAKALGFTRGEQAHLADVMEFFYNSHDGWDKAGPEEFSKQFVPWFKDLRKAIRALDKSEAEAASRRPRSFIPPKGGSASPNGKPSLLRPRDLARMAFHPPDATT